MRSSSEPGPGTAVRAAGASDTVEWLHVVAIVADRHGDLLERLLCTLEADLPVAWVLAVTTAAPIQRLAAVCALPLVEVGDDDTPLRAGSLHVATSGGCVVLQPALRVLSGEPGSPHRLLRDLGTRFGECAIAVMLDVDGSDHVPALREIAAAGGLVLSVVSQATADDLCPVERVAERIRAHCDPVGAARAPTLDRDSLDRILALLRAHTGHDFAGYKQTSLSRRIERRIGVHQLDNAAGYVTLLSENPREVTLLFKELLIGVTRFFRDPAAWQLLEQQVLPPLLAAHPAGRPLRAWIAGCSTGEEAYSLAIALHEAIAALPPQARPPLQVFASDLDLDAIERARAGWYSADIAGDVPAARLARHFEPERGGYRVGRAIRETVVFAPHNVFMDPPFSRLELLVCRNLLIYLSQPLQRRLFPLFHLCLRPGGVLFLGSAETVGRGSGMFEPIDERARLYRRVDVAVGRREPVEFPAALPRHWRDSETVAPNLQQLAEHQLLQHFTPAAVLVNAQGDILFINGRTGRYLEPAAGRANWNVYAMARPRIGQQLALVLPRALRERIRIDCPGIDIDGATPPFRIDLSVVGIDAPETLHGTALVLFRDAADAQPGESCPAAGAALQRELDHAREALLTGRDEMRAQQEQLKAVNEELQSANEELQSTNEELLTSRAEMQALNHELQAVNRELRSRLDELGQANSDIENLTDALGVATVFVDARLHVRSFSRHARQLFRLVASDLGRSIGDIACDLEYPQLADDAERVLRCLEPCERLVAARGTDGCSYRARITPYRTASRGVDGLLLSFMQMERTSGDPSERGR